ncbi:thioredoxin domain-containing protein, partial [Candidatus Peregrinibacteria bacterium]|nr:thioredoxin domain-containing protein [Candidatus Peregrinibacteria bacterium]
FSLPLSFHLPHAQDQAEAAECVGELEGNEAFWRFSDELYERTKSNKGFAYEKIQPLAEELGVNGSDFAACMESDRHLEIIQSHSSEASAMGISGTPGNLIRNNNTGEVKLLGGAYPFEAFTQIIDAMLK